MSLKIEYKNKNGLIHFDIKKDVPIEWLISLSQMTATLLSDKEDDDSDRDFVNVSNHSESNIEDTEIIDETEQDTFINENAMNRRRLRRQAQEEHPIILSEEQLGSYKEPDEGVRIKVLDYKNIVMAVRIFKECTGINVRVCKDIIEGKAVCPKLILETALTMINDFKDIGIVARIVNKDNWSWEVIRGGKQDDGGLTEREKAL